jgi:2,3-bisphosphoglycerate-independent phosphoglycerate mutase
MDRDNRWERTKRAYDAVTGVGPGETGPLRATSAVEFIRKSYESGVATSFVLPGTIVDAGGQPIGPVRDGDSVIFFNFRSDRARQLSRALTFDDFDGFERRPASTCR